MALKYSLIHFGLLHVACQTLLQNEKMALCFNFHCCRCKPVFFCLCIYVSTKLIFQVAVVAGATDDRTRGKKYSKYCYEITTQLMCTITALDKGQRAVIIECCGKLKKCSTYFGRTRLSRPNATANGANGLLKKTIKPAKSKTKVGSINSTRFLPFSFHSVFRRLQDEEETFCKMPCHPRRRTHLSLLWKIQKLLMKSC
jgi:hypothetical protein